jgi:predicted RNA-binding Zn-ribbon protein involved in translation (DUF1610 family)
MYDKRPAQNSVPDISSDIGATSYHCPNTDCDEYLRLSNSQLGRPQKCPKCGLAVTIGQSFSLYPIFLAVLGIVVGCFLGLGATHTNLLDFTRF